ncbi:F0F1 ATP synthase subunit A [Candidatus Viridilinea mediisalina]|uniref:ATP synthase subunit a n=1 Tax=Candidatus Viridilinea mediisalina TaxID=2024553 RepID=A0A2A6RK51_9CHLR|nr:F0F1 ATP synthase subunit A [Candidatus Viridilinea mediisalina]PDW03484.1 ATP synthase F0 subunit A [Candidatus Viridilinea mediisalina]
MSLRMRILLSIVVMIVVAVISRPLMYSGDPHVEVAAEALFQITPGIPFTNSLLMMLVVDVFLIGLALLVTRKMQDVPRGLQNVMEVILEAFYNIFRNISPKFVDRAFPLVATIFLYVLVSNWSGLIPGATSIGGCVPKYPEYNNEYTTCAPGYALIPFGRPPSTDLNFTLALGLISFGFFQYWGFKTLGLSYLSKFFNLNGIMSFVGIIEFISEIMKPIALALRLFGNIFAGEVLIAIIIFLVPLIVPMPIYVFEIFIGFIQAVVFALLTMAFLSIATTSHDHDDEHHGEAKGHAH